MSIKKLLTPATVVWIFAHVVTLATAIILIGPQNIENLYSHDPMKVLFAICGALVALGTTFGAGLSEKLVQSFHTTDVRQIEVDISKEPVEVEGTIKK